MIIVTRHIALVDYLIEKEVVPKGCEVLSHASKKEVIGQDVIGVLPMHLAALTKSITEIPLEIPADSRGKELTLEEVRKYAKPPVTYVVRRSNNCLLSAIRKPDYNMAPHFNRADAEKLRELKARKKLVNHLRKSGLGLVEINKLLVYCGYRK